MSRNTSFRSSVFLRKLSRKQPEAEGLLGKLHDLIIALPYSEEGPKFPVSLIFWGIVCNTHIGDDAL